MQKMIPNMFIRPQPKEFINEFIEKALKTPKSVGVSAIRICLAKNLEPELIKIKVPTLIILSQQDQKNLRNAGFQINKLIKNSKLMDIPDAKHLSFIDNPESFVNAITSFLSIQ